MDQRSGVFAALQEAEREIAGIVENTNERLVVTGWSRGLPAFPSAEISTRLGYPARRDMLVCGTTRGFNGMQYAALLERCDTWEACNRAGARFFQTVNAETRPSERTKWNAWAPWSLVDGVLTPHGVSEDGYPGAPHLFEVYNLWSLYVAAALVQSIAGMPAISLWGIDTRRPAAYDRDSHRGFFTTAVELRAVQLAAVGALRAPWIASPSDSKATPIAVVQAPAITNETLQPLDPSAYVPAKDILASHCQDTSVKTYKTLMTVLQKHREIKHWKPNKQRLLIHLADWHTYVESERAKRAGNTKSGVGAAPSPGSGQRVGPGRSQEQWRCKKCGRTMPRALSQTFECPSCSGTDGEPVMRRN